MHFLGRKPHPAFAGEVTIDSRKRAQGCRVRVRLKANAVKFYDHANVFRVETTINNPREFKVLRSPKDGTDQPPRWCPMTSARDWRAARPPGGRGCPPPGPQNPPPARRVWAVRPPRAGGPPGV